MPQFDSNGLQVITLQLMSCWYSDGGRDFPYKTESICSNNRWGACARSAKQVTMASPCSRAGIWGGLALLTMLLCTETAVGKDHLCSNQACKSPNSYAPKHFILVHGMGGGAWFWYQTVPLLERFGFKATAVDLTSHSINKVVADDVTSLAQYTKPLTDAIENAPGPVIIVGHSLAGGVAAYVSELYSTKVPIAIYLCAVMPSNSQTIFDAFPPHIFPDLAKKLFVTFNLRRGSQIPSSATLNANALKDFYMSETADEELELSKYLFVDTPFGPGIETLNLTPAKYGKVRRFYIRTGKDKAISPADQDTIIAANPPEKVFCMPRSDHAPFFSSPMELAKLLICISGQ